MTGSPKAETCVYVQSPQTVHVPRKFHFDDKRTATTATAINTTTSATTTTITTITATNTTTTTTITYC